MSKRLNRWEPNVNIFLFLKCANFNTPYVPRNMIVARRYESRLWTLNLIVTLLSHVGFLKQQPQRSPSPSISKIRSAFLVLPSDTITGDIKISELGTLDWDTFNPDFLIRISNVDTFNFNCLIHSLMDNAQKNQKPVFQKSLKFPASATRLWLVEFYTLLRDTRTRLGQSRD